MAELPLSRRAPARRRFEVDAAKADHFMEGVVAACFVLTIVAAHFHWI